MMGRCSLDELTTAVRTVAADYATCRYESRAEVTIRVSGAGTVTSMVSRSAGGLVQGFRGSRTGAASFSDPRAATEASRRLNLDVMASCPLVPATPCELFEPERPGPDWAAISGRADDMRSIVGVLARQPFLLSVRGELTLTSSRRLFVSSTGSRLSTQDEVWTAGVDALVSDGKVFHRIRWPVDQGCDPADFITEATHLLGSQRIRPGRYDIVLHPEVATLLVHEAAGHSLEADNHIENPILFECFGPGSRLGTTDLFVYDDPSPGRDMMADDEGVVSARVELIREGTVVGRLHSLTTAAIVGELPTGNGRAVGWRYSPLPRMRTIAMGPGTASDRDLLADTCDGIYVRRAVSGDTDGWNVDIHGTLAYRIANGELSQPLSGVTVSGTAGQLMSHIDGIGNTVGPIVVGRCGKSAQSGLLTWARAPHIRLRGVQLA